MRVNIRKKIPAIADFGIIV